LGKPYNKELQQLEETFRTVMEMDISPLETFISAACVLPLYAVGSGGSLSAAHFVAYLHQKFCNQIAKAITPLDAVDLAVTRQSCFWFLSAGGRNADINDAFKEVVTREPASLCVTCARTASPLAQYAQRYQYTDLFDFDLPSGRDGFLATNSLLAFAILTFRAYRSVFIPNGSNPLSLKDLLKHNGSMDSFLNNLRDQCSKIWERDTLLVLFGPATQAAAFDLESKFAEASLGHVLLADFRNFAHGRHHWLAKCGSTSAILALSTNNEKQIAEKTIGLIPQEVPIVHLNFSEQGIYSPIAALAVVLHLVALAGEARSIDPGRPGVPTFGKKIYHLRGLRKIKANGDNDIIIRRKIEPLFRYSEQYKYNLKEQAHKFIRELQRNIYSAVVLDYDGTLCTQKDRFKGLSTGVAEGLIRLLKGGALIGIATGRGKSVRISLRQAIPEIYWKRIIVGYYNGAECGYLSDETVPDGTEQVCSELKELSTALIKNIDLKDIGEITFRKHQITVEATDPGQLLFVWEIVNALNQKLDMHSNKVFASSHSVDILAPFVTKNTVIDVITKQFNIDKESPVLCIGDMGAWPGNDYELLNNPFSLSVDLVSHDSRCCWNLAPAGLRGVQAMLFYFKCMDANNGSVSFKLRKI
jgi:hydroxymethylpyrimidine pyrophosphatase-like HAD family hydrolase